MEDPTRQRTIWAGIVAVLSVVVLTMVALVIWGLNRGIGLTDEGFYLLSCLHPTLYPTFSSFHLILSRCPRLLDNDICHYRLLELLTRSTAAGCLNLCALKMARRQREY